MNNLTKRLASLSATKRELLKIELKKREIAEPIAIIGIGCRLPGGVVDPQSFWRLLCSGVDAITTVPASRWDIEQLYDPDPAKPGKMVTNLGGFLADIDQFDPAFFNISPREAQRMDPQQRLLLEVAWEALEDAGQRPDAIAGTKTGVFIGISTYDYGQMQLSNTSLYDAYAGTGSVLSIAANRLSYILDLHGPSLAVDTACSSSLVAIHLACQSLRNKEATMALVGGVNALISPTLTINFTKGGFMAPDGRCKSFDARANGYVRSEGCGVVVLKPLCQALDDGDPIYAVIRGSAINQDGRTNGLTAPNRIAQENVLKDAYLNACISPGLVQYIEAHGTGTPLGDPIEVQALGNVLSVDRADKFICALGSVKTNIGHLEAAAGIAGLIKVALSLKNQMLVPNLHFQQPNPKIDFGSLPLKVQTQLGIWPPHPEGRYAGVSSFGFGGTNAHIVLEEPPLAPTVAPPLNKESSTYLFPLSARSPLALQNLAQAYQNFISTTFPSLADLGYSTSCRRSHYNPCRLAIVAKSKEELVDNLQAFVKGGIKPYLTTSELTSYQKPKIIFVFSGQGQQWWGMGQQLFRKEPLFRAIINQCDAIITQIVPWSLTEEFMATETTSNLEKTAFAQPAICVLQIALAALWKQWGIEPDGVIGHSMGEVAAAYISGALTLADALKIIIYRGQLMERTCNQGKTGIVELSRAEIIPLLVPYGKRLSIAAYNSPTTTVISGEPAALDQFLQELQHRQVFCRIVSGHYAFHSNQMESLQAEFIELLEDIKPQVNRVPFFSTVTGTIIDGQSLTASYWSRNLRELVMFEQAIAETQEQDYNLYIELSAHPVLSPALTENLKLQGKKTILVASMRRGEIEQDLLLRAVGKVYTAGANINWPKLYPTGRYINLPHYTWQHQSYWLEKDEPKEVKTLNPPVLASSSSVTPQVQLFTKKIKVSTTPSVKVWEMEIATEQQPYLADHIVLEHVVVPGATYVATALTAFAEEFGLENFALEAIEFKKPLFLSDTQTELVQLVLTMNSPTGGEYHFASCQRGQGQESWLIHASGRLVLNPSMVAPPFNASTRLEAQTKGVAITKDTFYQLLKTKGLTYKDYFQGLQAIWSYQETAWADIEASVVFSALDNLYLCHPGILDACFQTCLATINQNDPRFLAQATYIPIKIESIQLHKAPVSNQRLWAQAELWAIDTKEMIKSNISVYDQEGIPIITIVGLLAQRVDETKNLLNKLFYRVEWVETPLAPTEAQANEPWLILANHMGVGHQLAQIVTAQGGQPSLLYWGADYKQLANREYQINPQYKEQFKQLLQELYQTQGCTKIVYLWALDVSINQKSWFEDSQQWSCLGLVYLVQALAELSWAVKPRLYLVTQGAQPLANHHIALGQYPLWGIGLTASYELTEYHPTRIDISASIDTAELAHLYQELNHNSSEDQLILRGSSRYVARLMKIPLPTSEGLSIHSHATYLITGGTGGLGLKVIQWLVAQGATSLVIFARTLPNPTVEESLDELRRAGVKVTCYQVDLGDLAQVEQAWQEMSRTCPPLKGVIHAAGVLDDGVLLRQTEARFNHVMRAKALGAWHLHQLSQGQTLDFFLLFSSTASVLGSPGQSNYAAANAFLDSLAHYRHGQGLPATSINWGPWAEVGMAARQSAPKLVERGLQAIPPDIGSSALTAIIPYKEAQIVAFLGDVQQWCQHYPQIAELPFLSRLITTQVKTSPKNKDLTIRERLLTASHTQHNSLLADYLRSQIAQILKISEEQIGLQSPLSNLGLDSLVAIELGYRLEEELGVVLPVTLVWNYPTIAAMVTYLSKEMGLKDSTTESAPSLASESVPISAQETKKTLDALAKIKKLQDKLSKG